MSPVLQFDEAEHVYSVDGQPIPGVTSVLEDVGIIDYSQIPDGTRIRALERGRIVHKMCHFDDEGALDLSTVDPSLTGYLEAWRNARRDLKFRPALMEYRLFNLKSGYAGTLDRTGTVPQSDSVLADIKTGSAPMWTAFQTAAYANCFENPARWRRMAIELHADGTYKVYEYRCSDFSKHLNVFMAALTVYNTKRRKQ